MPLYHRFGTSIGKIGYIDGGNSNGHEKKWRRRKCTAHNIHGTRTQRHTYRRTIYNVKDTAQNRVQVILAQPLFNATTTTID